MNSNKKFQETQDLNVTPSSGVLSSDAIFKAKIKYQIDSYLYRKFSAEGEISNLTKCIAFNSTDYAMISKWRSRITILVEEIKFCKEQIYAYQNNDNKRKMIPDRCL